MHIKIAKLLCVGVFTHMDGSDHQENVPTETMSGIRKILTMWNLKKNGLLGIISLTEGSLLF